jgi:hypothetical protein
MFGQCVPRSALIVTDRKVGVVGCGDLLPRARVYIPEASGKKKEIRHTNIKRNLRSW